MKVNLNLTTSQSYLQRQQNVRSNSISTVQNTVSSTPNYGVLSFGGNKNPNQVLLVTAETKPYFQVGGVATVVEQYPEHVFNGAKNTPIIMPYYNGKLQYNDKGDVIGASVLMKDGKPIITNEDLKKVPVEKITPNKYWELEKITDDKKMDFAGREESFSVYKIKDKNHYVVFNKETAMMPKPYADGSYSSDLKSQLGKTRDAYAKFNKAVVEVLPELEAKEGINPKAIVMNDGQTAYLPEYIAQKVKNGKGDYFKDMKLSYVQHNLGEGYQQVQSARQMFLNFATKEQIDAVMKDPVYKATLEKVPGEGMGVIEDYFKPMVQKFTDADKKISASMIPIQYAKNGNMAHINTVSEMYLANALKNPTVAPGLTNELRVLEKQGVLSGILNGMSSNAGPENPIKIKVDNVETTPFITFKPTDDIDKIFDIKRQNKIIFLDRLSKAGTDPKAVGLAQCMDPNRIKNVFGSISPEIVQALKDGEDIKLFTSWGRGDLQKGIDNVFEAFEKLASKPNGKKAVLVVGGGVDHESKEGAKILQILDRMSENPNLKGRFMYVDGFANAEAFSIGADATIFPSRFAPCELTDLESMKFGTSTIVTDTEGLAQKNFDVRDGLDKATGYKTKASYDMLPEELEKLSPEFKEKYATLKDKFAKNIADKKLEFELAGVKADDVIKKMEKDLPDTVHKSDEFKMLWRKYTDKQISNELAEAMSLKINEPPEVSQKLIRNTLDMQAMWENNDALHGDVVKSSKLLYKERHLDASMKTPSEPLFNFDNRIFERAKEAVLGKTTTAPVAAPNAVSLDNASDAISFNGWSIKNTASDAFDSTKNLMSEATTYTKKLMSGSVGKKIGAVAAGVLALGAALCYMFKPEKNETKHASTYVA